MSDLGVAQAFMAADLADKCSWPEAGGWLDQSAEVVECVRLVTSERSRWEAIALSKTPGGLAWRNNG